MIKSITSAQNPLFKELKKISLGKASSLYSDVTLIEGAHLAQSLLKNSTPVVCIVNDGYAESEEVSQLVSLCESRDVETIVVSAHLFTSLSLYKNTESILILFKKPKKAAPDKLTKSALLIDRLQDPGNLGTIIRTAAAAEIKEIYCSKGTVSAWSPKVLRAAVGAHFSISIYENVDLESVVKGATIPVLATTPTAKTTIYQADLKKSTAWLVGHEGQGVLTELIDLSDQQLSIPHSSEVESLNAASATAVCLFEQYRQRF